MAAVSSFICTGDQPYEYGGKVAHKAAVTACFCASYDGI